MNALSSRIFSSSRALIRPAMKPDVNVRFSRPLSSLQSVSYMQRACSPLSYTKRVPGGHQRWCSHAATAQAIHIPPSSFVEELAEAAPSVVAAKEVIGCIPIRKYIEFTCGVCNVRVAKNFSKQSYEQGVVLIRCHGCNNLHLISDNVDFTGFDERNIEEIAANRGETVTTTWEGELLGVTTQQK